MPFGRFLARILKVRLPSDLEIAGPGPKVNNFYRTYRTARRKLGQNIPVFKDYL